MYNISIFGWAQLIQNFKFSLVHCLAKENKLPDFFSREPGLENTIDVLEELWMQPTEEPLCSGTAPTP